MYLPGDKIDSNGIKGTVGAVGITGGERYYWIICDGVVTMIPAFMVETLDEDAKRALYENRWELYD